MIGRQHLSTMDRAFVVVANHASHLDASLIFGALPRRLARYLAAGAAADYFFDVWWRRGLTALFFNAFPVERSSNKRAGVGAKALLQRGIPLLIFPEGTRSTANALGHFQLGAAALAASTGVPCLPVALIGTGIAHPPGTKWPRRGRPPVGVVIGSPMAAAEGEPPAAFMAWVRAEIVRLLDEHSVAILNRTTAL
ncbi:lysophospholipid acyltransferase family protein [Micromonospora zamorensis]|uniref:lysophospholipid acyltransferase family protein n=1 Tax=Micromonospora zamorensis TaxID=709883 RepID=UPI003D9551B5